MTKDELDALDVTLLELLEQNPLESFLDRAGDTRAVADQLGIHRASVYQRMNRIEQLTGLRLDDGEQRLAAHLSIKIARLAHEDATYPDT